MSQKVLLVDDEPKVLASLRRCLAERFDLTCAGSGDEALAIVERDGPFAAIVSDVRMPGMDGLTLLREMRRRVPETVRLVLSGHADFAAVVAAINEGAVFRFHTKPVAPEVLTESLECALVRHHKERTAGGWVDPGKDLVRDVAEIRRAMANGDLRLYLQPQWRVGSETVIGAEALVRWNHPERGLLLPGAFLGAVEAGDLVGELTSHMLDLACAELRHWAEQDLPAMRIAVNATALDFGDNSFPARVMRVLERHGVAPAGLEMELTEGLAIADIPGTQAVVKSLRGHGVVTSIDDFGSGHATLGWLRKLPVSKLKIDRMFVEDLTVDAEAYRMLETIVTLARDLRLSVLAEGVETMAQMELVRRAGCDAVQGFLVARPMPAEDFVPWLRRGARWDGAGG